MKTYFNKLRSKRSITLLKIFVSAILLYVIFRKIDIPVFIDTFRKAKPYLIIIGLLIGYLLQVLTGLVRWYYSLRVIFGVKVSFLKLAKIFWEGMFIGYFLPASIGWDVYRVIQASSLNISRYDNVTIIIWEKINGIIGCVILFVISYPFVRGSISEDYIQHIIFNIWKFGVALIIVIMLLLLLLLTVKVKPAFIGKIVTIIKLKLDKIINRFVRDNANSVSSDVLMKKFMYIVNLKGLPFLLLSLSIKVLPALGSVIYFNAIGVKITLAMALFTSAIIILIHMLPISFGSLGIREGTYILIFGFFGVAAEDALTVSFIGLISLLFTISLGGISILLSGSKSFIQKDISTYE